MRRTEHGDSGLTSGAGTAGAWPVMVSAVVLSGALAAVVAVATVRLAAPEPPRIATVRLAEITAAYATQAAAEGRTTEDLSAGVRAWGEALEAALGLVAERDRLVLLPARAIAAGAPDATARVEFVLSEVLSHRGSHQGSADLSARGAGLSAGKSGRSEER